MDSISSASKTGAVQVGTLDAECVERQAAVPHSECGGLTCHRQRAVAPRRMRQKREDR